MKLYIYILLLFTTASARAAVITIDSDINTEVSFLPRVEFQWRYANDPSSTWDETQKPNSDAAFIAWTIDAHQNILQSSPPCNNYVWKTSAQVPLVDVMKKSNPQHDIWCEFNTYDHTAVSVCAGFGLYPSGTSPQAGTNFFASEWKCDPIYHYVKLSGPNEIEIKTTTHSSAHATMQIDVFSQWSAPVYLEIDPEFNIPNTSLSGSIVFSDTMSGNTIVTPDDVHDHASVQLDIRIPRTPEQPGWYVIPRVITASVQ